MKKCITTILCSIAFMFVLSPMLTAQENGTQENEVIIIQKIKGDDGIQIEHKTLEKGEKLKAYLKDLHLHNSDAKDVKIQVLTDEAIQLSESDLEENEEMIFMYRAAGEHLDNEELEKLVITRLNGHVADAPQTSTDPKPLLGIYNDVVDEGILITGVVYDGGAKKAGLQENDIITALDGQKVTSTAELRAAIQKHKVGESIVVDYLRMGTPGQVTSVLGAKKEKVRRHYSHHNTYYYRHNVERNPCDVFIGVYTNTTRNGRVIQSVIEGTSAANSELQKGDIITALDDVEVRTHTELCYERDKHKPGDVYTLSILRDNQPMDLDLQFLTCPTDEIEEPVVEVKEEEIVEEVPELPELEITQNNLELTNFNAFPNPTAGPFNLRFNGEATATTIRVTDSSGKVVYEEVLNNFDGYYDNKLELKNAMPGTLIVTVQQGQKIYTESMILMPRA